jgi:hypothetical protein
MMLTGVATFVQCICFAHATTKNRVFLSGNIRRSGRCALTYVKNILRRRS